MRFSASFKIQDSHLWSALISPVGPQLGLTVGDVGRESHEARLLLLLEDGGGELGEPPPVQGVVLVVAGAGGGGSHCV